MKSKYEYYGIAGTNGYGITKSWDDCLRCIKYFRGVKYKGFYNKEEAYYWVQDEFFSKCEYGCHRFKSLEELERKKLVFTNKE